MGFLKFAVGSQVVSVGLIALLAGIFEIKHEAVRPLQRHIIDGLEAFLDSFQDPSSTLEWATEFNGALLPTTPVQNLALTPSSGAVPKDVSGVYLRVGPNVAIWPPQKPTHVFDGDGMVYSVRLHEGKATFHCDYIQTPRYKYEQEAGRAWALRLGEFSGVSGLMNVITVHKWKMKYAGLSNHDNSAANTAIGFTPDNKVWALHQSGPPFRLRVNENGSVDSVGFDKLKGTLKDAVSAHPKYDYRTGEIFYHGLDPENQRLYVGRIAGGILQETAELKSDPPVGQGFNHDMFITRDYAVVIDGAMRFDIPSLLKGSSLWNFDTTQKLRFGVYERIKGHHGKMTADEFIWIEAPFAAEIVHTMFGYNEGDKIILWTSICFHDSKRSGGTYVLGGMGLLQMARLVIDVSARTVTYEEVEGGSDYITEFGRVREDRVAGKARYGYSASAPPAEGWKDFNFTGLLKWDMEEKKRSGVIQFAPGIIGGEPIFIPNGEAEDDGYLSLFLWNTVTQNTTFVLYDAKTFSDKPVVELAVPWRVPLGFHGWWLSEQQLKTQLAAF